MKQGWLAFTCALLVFAPAPAADVLIVADELPAMEVLAGRLKAQEGVAATVVTQDRMPPGLPGYAAVIVYIHRNLDAAAERAFIDYTTGGGRLVVLHHSISSGKRKNKDWFPFLGIELPTGDAEKGGYKWIEPATLGVVNLAPGHFITTNKVDYPTNLAFAASAAGPAAPRPGIVLPESEVYLNHVWTAERTPLLGLRYTDPKSGRTWMQDTAGWLRPAGRGLIVYLMPGHSALDFENPAYARIVVNAVIFRP